MLSVPLNKITTMMPGSVSFGTKYENHITGADSTASFSGATWAGQIFKANTGHTLTGIKLELFADGGDPGLVTIGIQALSGGDPDGTDLSAITFEGALLPIIAGTYKEITMPPTVLSVGVSYAIVARCVTGNPVKWRQQTTGAYGDGNKERSTDSGGTWTASGPDHMFEEWGFV